MTVLTICQDVCDTLSLTRPPVVVTSTDIQVRQLFALLKEGADELSKYAPDGSSWQALTRQQTFITVNQVEQTNSPVPEDFRNFIPNSFWDRTTERPVAGPLTPQQWQALQARPAIAFIYLAYRQRDGKFLLGSEGTPPPAGDEIAYEYVSSWWAKSSAGQAKPTFTSDDDTSYLPESLLKLDLKWRWKHAKGLDYGEDMRNFERAKEAAFAKDGGATALNIGGQSYDGWPDYRYNIPEGSWPPA